MFRSIHAKVGKHFPILRTRVRIITRWRQQASPSVNHHEVMRAGQVGCKYHAISTWRIEPQLIHCGWFPRQWYFHLYIVLSIGKLVVLLIVDCYYWYCIIRLWKYLQLHRTQTILPGRWHCAEETFETLQSDYWQNGTLLETYSNWVHNFEATCELTKLCADAVQFSDLTIHRMVSYKNQDLEVSYKNQDLERERDRKMHDDSVSCAI